MTAVRLGRDRSGYRWIELSGHSGYSESGSDIVCAALTAAIRLVETTLNDVAHANIAAIVTDEPPLIRLTAPKNSPKQELCHTLFSGFASLTEQLQAEYPDYISMEVLTNA